MLKGVITSKLHREGGGEGENYQYNTCARSKKFRLSLQNFEWPNSAA